MRTLRGPRSVTVTGGWARPGPDLDRVQRRGGAGGHQGYGEPMIVVDPASAVPPYEQLRAQLARQIQNRTLAVGTRLPTIRRMAADLGLGQQHRGTALPGAGGGRADRDPRSGRVVRAG